MQCGINASSPIHLIRSRIKDGFQANFSFFLPMADNNRSSRVLANDKKTANSTTGKEDEEQKKASIVLDVIVEAIFIIGKSWHLIRAVRSYGSTWRQLVNRIGYVYNFFVFQAKRCIKNRLLMQINLPFMLKNRQIIKKCK